MGVRFGLLSTFSFPRNQTKGLFDDFSCTFVYVCLILCVCVNKSNCVRMTVITASVRRKRWLRRPQTALSAYQLRVYCQRKSVTLFKSTPVCLSTVSLPCLTTLLIFCLLERKLKLPDIEEVFCKCETTFLVSRVYKRLSFTYKGCIVDTCEEL